MEQSRTAVGPTPQMWLLMIVGVLIDLLEGVGVLPWWAALIGAFLVIYALWLYMKARRAAR
jgi:hypothetical protein